jgi:hypothetical protein
MASARNRLPISYFLRIALLAGAPVSVGLCDSLPEKVSVDKPGPQEAALNARANVDGVPGNSPDPSSPYPLTPQQCQRQAVANSTIANLLDREREDLDRKQGAHFMFLNHKSTQATTLKDEILTDAANEVRNQTASGALEAYFRLAETEARSELAEKAAFVIADAVARGRKLKDQGFKTPPELDTLERKEIDLKSDTAQLRLAQTRLQHDLKALLGPPANSPPHLIRPVLDMHDYVPPGEISAEVANGLAYRPELRMWRTLGQSLDAASLPVAQSALQTVNPLAGSAPGKGASSGGIGLKALLAMCKGQADADAVRQEILIYEASREQQIASDIRRDVRLIAIQTEILVLARRRAADNLRRVEELTEQQAKGLTTFADTAKAQLDFLQARGTVVEAVATLFIYQVKLRQDQGLLTCECYPGSEAVGPTPSGSIPGTTAP